jgi:hypothetical protein
MGTSDMSSAGSCFRLRTPDVPIPLVVAKLRFGRLPSTGASCVRVEEPECLLAGAVSCECEKAGLATERIRSEGRPKPDVGGVCVCNVSEEAIELLVLA